jgi:hypothetical protein
VDSWVLRQALDDAEFNRDGPEVWRDLKVAAEIAVRDFNNCYCQPKAPEFAFNACREVSDDCFRVRRIPGPGERERWAEFWFRPEKRAIDVKTHPQGHASIPQGFIFGREKPEAKIGLLLWEQGSSTDRPPRAVSFDEASRLLLHPFLFADGPREPINPPKPI